MNIVSDEVTFATAITPGGHPADPDALVDPRIQELLHAYVRLSNALLRDIGPECVELSVPPSDRVMFGNRSSVVLALSLNALETHPTAEMAILGGIFVSQLIEAVRARGTCINAGDVVGSIPPPATVAPLDIPVANGSASTPNVRVARHPVGRLTARVTVRAGASLEEYLVDSELFDLATGALLDTDVADACRTTESMVVQGNGNDPHLDDSSGSVYERIPARPADDFISAMLGSLERNLAPTIAAQRADAERELALELARLDRYYRALLEDSAAHYPGRPVTSQHAITSEHKRRRGEEIRRHQVRATVHPLQLVEWTVPVQRAEWTVTGVAGLAVPIVGERPLVGSGTWTIVCSQCGHITPSAIVVCRHGHAACDSCAASCSVCGEGCCSEHELTHCHVDSQPVCDQHAGTCSSCRRIYCSTHDVMCSDGNHTVCSACVAACEHCARVICNMHATQSVEGAPLGNRRLCANCVRYCEGGTNEPVGVDEAVRCASCDKWVCSNHDAVCAVDGNVHCSKHLRRTDTSRRLVCEHDRATCAYEPYAVFATDEVTTCIACRAVICDSHADICAVDGGRYCTTHLAHMHDRKDGLACEKHRTTCHVDNLTFSLTGTRECPICGKRACTSHTQRCTSCARDICVTDVASGARSTCITCRKLTYTPDPSDTLIQASVAALGQQRSSPRQWRTARDVSHVIVELDLGWTRRMVFSIRHGEATPDTVVHHSILGSSVSTR